MDSIGQEAFEKAKKGKTKWPSAWMGAAAAKTTSF
jgi:hypothetical protein